MKKALTIAGYLILSCALLAIAGIGSLSVFGTSLDRESKAYVDASVPAIISAWSTEEIRKRASIELDQDLDYDELAMDFEYLSGLGKLEEYRGATGEATIIIGLTRGFEITADYVARADFESGSVEIPITLVRRGGTWQILDFTITPLEYSERRDVI